MRFVRICNRAVVKHSSCNTHDFLRTNKKLKIVLITEEKSYVFQSEIISL